MPACKICSRADVVALTQALHDAAEKVPGAETLSSIASRLGVGKGSLIAHRDGCAGLEAKSSDRARTVDGPDDLSPTAPRPFVTEKRAPDRPPSDRADREREESISLNPKLAADETLRVMSDRIRGVALMIAQGRWRDLQTVEGLAAKWGVEAAEVIRVHRIAAAHVAAARGPMAAQLEAAVGWLTWMRDAQTALAKGYEDMVPKLLANNASGAKARNAKRLASQAQLVALQAQKELDRITVARPTSLSITLSVQAAPDFAAAWEVIASILSERFPGACEEVEQGLAVYEERGRAALTAWLSGRAVDVIEAAPTH